MLNSPLIKSSFPIFSKKINGKNLIYLDNASTTQKPKSVIEKITDFYESYNSNIGRSATTLAEKATQEFEETREEVKNFINAKYSKEIIFTRNTTESINQIAYLLEDKVKEDDEILVTIFEHHSNFVPWQELAKRKNAKFLVANLDKNLELDIEDFKKKLSNKTKIVAVSATSNVLGLKEDMENLSKIIKANAKNAIFIVDGAQSIAHEKTNVQKIDCDFFAFSAHKMLGPTGVGVLYAKSFWLENLNPILFGGSMISEVSTDKTYYADPPAKFEAGTPDISGVIAFKEAIKFLKEIGLENIEKHEKELFKYAISLFSKEQGIKIFAPKNPEKQSGIFSFTHEKIHAHDISQIFNDEGIMIRAGMHCAHPLHEALETPATARMSFYLYNSEEDIENAYKAIQKAIKLFS